MEIAARAGGANCEGGENKQLGRKGKNTKRAHLSRPLAKTEGTSLWGWHPPVAALDVAW